MPHFTTVSHDDLLSPAEVGAALGVTDETIRRWAKTGKLPVVQMPSGRFRVRRSDVEAILAPTTEPAA